MTELKCDICGGKLIIQANGHAKCESCGIEYTEKRLKNKIQEIRGTVQIDGVNTFEEKIDNIRTLLKFNEIRQAEKIAQTLVTQSPSSVDTWIAMAEISFCKYIKDDNYELFRKSCTGREGYSYPPLGIRERNARCKDEISDYLCKAKNISRTEEPLEAFFKLLSEVEDGQKDDEKIAQDMATQLIERFYNEPQSYTYSESEFFCWDDNWGHFAIRDGKPCSGIIDIGWPQSHLDMLPFILSFVADCDKNIGAYNLCIKSLKGNDIAEQRSQVRDSLVKYLCGEEILLIIKKSHPDYAKSKFSDFSIRWDIASINGRTLTIQTREIDPYSNKIECYPMKVHIKGNFQDVFDEVKELRSTGGCYIATSVYGSYNCPQVWTLRRFRDEILAKSWYGCVFIHTYYAISPIIVKWFGQTGWFNNFWKAGLDGLVSKLQEKGISDQPYQD